MARKGKKGKKWQKCSEITRNGKILKKYIKKCYNQTKIIMFDYDMDKTSIV